MHINSVFKIPHYLNCGGTLLDISSPVVMGILNITPDSFFDGGKYNNIDNAISQAEKIIEEGASIIDLGAYSSRPGAVNISEQEESNRLMPVLNALIKRFNNIIISIDTFRSSIANEAILNGASIINDISGGNLDEKVLDVVAKHKVPYVLMHMRGTPENMTTQNNYDDIVSDLFTYFHQKINKLNTLGVNDIIIDPGFGFSKNIEQNFTLMKKLNDFKIFQRPLLVGISRKSMIYKTLNVNADESLNGTTALNMIALNNGAKILRVHDVRQANEAIKLFNSLQKA